MMATDLLWRVFETTGSVIAYLVYRKLVLQ
ncbi:MAG: YqzL-like protein [Bacillota bacterium]|jgi:hypothetical protein|nr:YqzL-like protein [Bacillota bacterium]MDK2926274.1 YqzL-like protein [Bacillota bacterium]MDK2960823.1 YqzL-like protein [Bacillota bacterium]